MYAQFISDKLKRRHHWGILGVDERIIFKSNFLLKFVSAAVIMKNSGYTQ
jgi:hypothetical protein